MIVGIVVCLVVVVGLLVYVVICNDYFVGCDVEKNIVFFKVVGFSVGVVVYGVECEDCVCVYVCYIIYCMNKELVFDYLCDCVVMGGWVGVV